MNEDARWLDGNAIGGLLQELFGADMTASSHVCQSCETDRPLAAHRLYMGAGPVLRCPVCDQIALVVTSMRDRHLMHLNGAWRMEMPR